MHLSRNGKFRSEGLPGGIPDAQTLRADQRPAGNRLWELLEGGNAACELQILFGRLQAVRIEEVPFGVDDDAFVIGERGEESETLIDAHYEDRG